MQLLTKKEDKKAGESEFFRLLQDGSFLKIPKVGDIVKGSVVYASKNEIRIDIPGYKAGVVRGPELSDTGEDYTCLVTGDEVEATVLELENEVGNLELSFRFAGAKRLWEGLQESQNAGTTIEAQIVDANKGGLMAKVGRMVGFIPVSQLAPEHYPRVSGGEKHKILERLRSLIGQALTVKVIDTNRADEKLILSEKAVWEDAQRSTLAAYKPGDIVEGEVTAVTDFGAFVKFDSLEGLVHISEIAWSRVNHPSDLLKIGDRARCQVLSVQGSKIFLSMKRLTVDPWKTASERYQVGAVVKGKILKSNPFGFFVELDSDIHGLAHVSELSDKPIGDPLEAAAVGDTLEWKVISVDPEAHRLGLSRKALTAKPDESGELTSTAP